MGIAEPLQWVTSIIAVYAALIGTFNYFHARKRDRPAIALTPMIARLRNGRHRLAFDIQNEGIVATSITQIGFIRRPDSIRTVFHPTPIDGLSLPIFLEAGTKRTIYVPPRAMKDASSDGVRCAYILTAHGTTVKARNGALIRYIDNPPDTATDEELFNASENWGNIIASEHGIPKGTLPGQ